MPLKLKIEFLNLIKNASIEVPELISGINETLTFRERVDLRAGINIDTETINDKKTSMMLAINDLLNCELTFKDLAIIHSELKICVLKVERITSSKHGSE